jgi:hypothetical protein
MFAPAALLFERLLFLRSKLAVTIVNRMPAAGAFRPIR